jgi:hypothetical protein
MPSPTDLPTSEDVRGWHEDLVRAGQLHEAANAGPARALRVTPEGAENALNLAEALHALVTVHSAIVHAPWLVPFHREAIRGESNAWNRLLRERLEEWSSYDADRAALARRSVQFPEGFLDNDDARAAVIRAAAGERLWPIFSINKGAAKTLVADIKLDGASMRGDDLEGWRHIAAVMAHATRLQEITARWIAFASEVGAPTAPSPKGSVDLAYTVIRIADTVYAYKEHLSTIVAASIGSDDLIGNPELCRSVADQIKAAASAVRLATVREHIRRTLSALQASDRTSAAARQFFERAVGNPDLPAEKIESFWRNALQRIAAVKARAGDYATILEVTDGIA